MSSRRSKKQNQGEKEVERDVQDGAAGSRAERRDIQKDAAQKLERFAWNMSSASKQQASRALEQPQPSTSSGGSRYTPLLNDPDSVPDEGIEEGRPESPCDTQRSSEESQGTDKGEPSLADLLKAINRCDTSISKLACHVGGLKEEMLLLRNDLHKVSDRTTEVENRVSTVEDTLLPMRRDINMASQHVNDLFIKTDDLENRLRRNNVRLVGVPERVEGGDPDSFFENWLKTTFGRDTLTPLFAVERAHRVPTRPGPPGRPPRPVLIKILHYRDRDIILKKAREMPDVQINGNRVSFFPDFSVAVQKQRAQFQDVKRRLRALNVSYSMLYPAKLRVAAMGTVTFLDNPKDALRWIDSHEEQLRQERPQNN